MKIAFSKKQLFSLAGLGLLLTTLLLVTYQLRKTQPLTPRAEGKLAEIVVNPSVNRGPIHPFWQALAQGGEEKSQRLAPVIDQVTNLKPQHIRLDHIWDHYDVVSRQQGELYFDWERLDQIVDDILKTGATPFFSLSFMPQVLAKNGQVTDAPADWSEWQETVKNTIQHFSGKNQKNLTGVHYEVWSEPDLFGGWKINGDKDYKTLYYFSVQGAAETKETNPFRIGGPATTALYQNWIDTFLNYVLKNNLRLDFYSWHRYSLDPEVFSKDVGRLSAWLGSRGPYYQLPKLITEWGSTPENSTLHDEPFDAAHLIAVTRQLLQKVDFAFTFEVKDGPPPTEKELWGRWGILTYSGIKKPRYYALELLNQVVGDRIELSGEGSWVSGFAAKNQNQIILVLTNLDQDYLHQESVPVTFTNLKKGEYSWEENTLTGQVKKSVEITENGLITKQILMPPNSVVLVKLTGPSL